MGVAEEARPRLQDGSTAQDSSMPFCSLTRSHFEAIVKLHQSLLQKARGVSKGHGRSPVLKTAFENAHVPCLLP